MNNNGSQCNCKQKMNANDITSKLWEPMKLLVTMEDNGRQWKTLILQAKHGGQVIYRRHWNCNEK